MLLSRICQKPCMFLLFLCLGTILAPSYRRSCQATSSPPPLSGPVGALSSHPFSCSTTAPMPSCAAAPCSFTIRVRSRDEVITVSRLKACTAADATPGSLHRCGRPTGSHPGGPAATNQVSFSDPLVSSPSPLVLPRDSPGTIFPYPARRFLHARDWRRHHRCHRRGTCPVKRHRHRGWTSDLFSSRQRPELEGEPCGHLLTPMAMVKPVGCTPITLYCSCI
jgi:hypothetical protein